MNTVPNQRTVTTNKEQCDKSHLYTPINLEAMHDAMQKLSGNAYKLWSYLGKNQNDYTFALSRADVMEWCGFSKNTYTSAFNELIEEGFLMQREDSKNHYDFYEISQNKEEVTITTHKEEFVF